MKSILEQKFKEKSFENSSEEFKNRHRTITLDNIFKELGDRKNRYIFYCPDIAIVNSLVRTIYEMAYTAKELGYNVLILHETDGFKCKWLTSQKEFSHLRKVPLDYIIIKKGKKSKKTRSDYAFRISDTLIIPDQFQEMLDNIIEVKLIQKVILSSSYTGLSALNPGTTYESLGVDKVIFTDKQIAKDYNELFQLSSNVISGFNINKEYFSNREAKKVLPLISISNIGNNDVVQQLINVFYNKYPNLRVFNFRLLDRDDMNLYIETIRKSAIVLFLDKNLGSAQVLLEPISIGCPVGTMQRQELNLNLSENVFIGNNAFEIAERLAEFCTLWLCTDTDVITEQVLGLKEDIISNEEFTKNINDIFYELQENRVLYFNKIKASINVSQEGI